MVALAISLVRFWFEKKIVWFGSVVAALKSLKSTAEDASNLEAGILADGRLPDNGQRWSRCPCLRSPLHTQTTYVLALNCSYKSRFGLTCVRKMVWCGFN